MRCSMLATSFSAPSAVWTTEMPSCALLTAWPMPPICALMFWLITRPDASSAAELIREPDESFCRLLETAESVADRLRYASNAVTLVLTRRLMRTELLVSVPTRPWPDRPGIRARKIPIDETGTEMSEPDKIFPGCCAPAALEAVMPASTLRNSALSTAGTDGRAGERRPFGLPSRATFHLQQLADGCGR